MSLIPYGAVVRRGPASNHSCMSEVDASHYRGNPDAGRRVNRPGGQSRGRGLIGDTLGVMAGASCAVPYCWQEDSRCAVVHDRRSVTRWASSTHIRTPDHSRRQTDARTVAAPLPVDAAEQLSALQAENTKLRESARP